MGEIEEWTPKSYTYPRPELGLCFCGWGADGHPGGGSPSPDAAAPQSAPFSCLETHEQDNNTFWPPQHPAHVHTHTHATHK